MIFSQANLPENDNLSPASLRIVSLVPSITELLYDLGLEDEVVGITKFCVRPQHWFQTKTRVGGTKNVDVEKVASLKPTLIIANKEENEKVQVEALQDIAPVFVSDVSTLDEALDMINHIGNLVGRKENAREIINTIRENFSSLAGIGVHKPAVQKKRAAYLIWRSPYMAAGGDTFIHDMMVRCGLENVLSGELRYPEVTLEQLSALGCELLMLSSEPYPFNEKHAAEMRQQLPSVSIVFVDGEMFSWYGSRLIHAAAYFTVLMNEISQKR